MQIKILIKNATIFLEHTHIICIKSDVIKHTFKYEYTKPVTIDLQHITNIHTSTFFKFIDIIDNNISITNFDLEDINDLFVITNILNFLGIYKEYDECVDRLKYLIENNMVEDLKNISKAYNNHTIRDTDYNNIEITNYIL
tara:strand:+ start:436 stop:858 length:423 start_codon:yes stop_codon:yes gene_type:complete